MKRKISFAIKTRPQQIPERAQSVAIRFMLKTGDLARDSPETFSRLQEDNNDSIFESRT
jgi:hypothetical protein